MLALTIDGLDKTTNYLNNIKLKSNDYTGVEAQLYEILRKDAELRFKSSPPSSAGGEVYGGVYWKELSESYLVSNPHRRTGKVYIDTGNLRDSLTIPNHPDSEFEINGTEIVFGTSAPDVDKLNKSRPILFWHPLLLKQVADYLATWLIESENL